MSLLRSAVDWLVEPELQRPEPEAREPRPQAPVDVAAHESAAPPPAAVGPRPVVAVCGLRRRCGATTIARAIGTELARRDPIAAAAVVCGSAPAQGPALPGARRLTRALEPLGVPLRGCGRLALVSAGPQPSVAVAGARAFAPVVADLGCDPAARHAAADADAVVLVAPADADASLAAVVWDSLAAVGPRPLLVLNRDRGETSWEPHARVPASRLGARLAAAGREPGGGFGRALGQLLELAGLDG